MTLASLAARALAPLALSAAVALSAAAPARALDFKNMTPDEKAAFGEEVRAYLLDHPEVLVEAIDRLKAKQAQQQVQNDANLVKANAKAIFEDPNSWVGGNPNGDITLVEFMDYRCGYCHKAYPEVAQLLKTDGNIRFIVKEFPILSDQSVLGSRFAIAVLQLNGPDAYAKAHDALMKMRANITDASLAALAGKLGLDAEAIKARMDSPEVTKVIADNHALAKRLGINGTPTFVLGDQMLRGYVPLAQMTEIVKEVRAN
ncbi:DsbA family protein [Acidimangrovimonas pyrenivorans]|uniref:DsbA family protein n=1 Tax=Acidimangrovimonas pyrenivorans TaxID=2030798 RepID=A0ABV7ALE7_9RHOB